MKKRGEVIILWDFAKIGFIAGDTSGSDYTYDAK